MAPFTRDDIYFGTRRTLTRAKQPAWPFHPHIHGRRRRAVRQMLAKMKKAGPGRIERQPRKRGAGSRQHHRQQKGMLITLHYLDFSARNDRSSSFSWCFYAFFPSQPRLFSHGCSLALLACSLRPREGLRHLFRLGGKKKVTYTGDLLAFRPNPGDVFLLLALSELQANVGIHTWPWGKHRKVASPLFFSFIPSSLLSRPLSRRPRLSIIQCDFVTLALCYYRLSPAAF